jgi:hypothetical protein
MFLISHRGNLVGPKIDYENTIPYIEEALNNSFLCEIDFWYVDGKLFLGHDTPDHAVSISFLETYKSQLWIHCKNLLALDYLTINHRDFNFFWHQTDDFTLTSKGFIWTFPNKPTVQKSILVHLGKPHQDLNIAGISGVCSDFIYFFK